LDRLRFFDRRDRQWGTLGLLILLLVGLRWLGVGGSSEVGGLTQVIDGDSLRVGGDEVRLEGIDAPEGRQTCLRGQVSWPCGKEARAALERLVRQGTVTCRSSARDQHGRLLGTCRAGETEINATLVAQGWAVASGRGVNAPYLREQRSAEEKKLGIWQGTFTWPREWRREHGIGR
jgi:endonuclease YncB( thermonuclease family)